METTETTEKEYSKLQWFLYVVLIPSVFTLIIVGVLLYVSGFNSVGAIKDFGAKIPGISGLFQKEETKQQETSEPKVSVPELKATISEKEAKITELEDELGLKEDEINALQEDIDRLSNEIHVLQDERLAKSKTIEELTKMYELMSPKNAALIIPNLNENEAREILSSLKTEKLAAILEKMSPEDAARFTELLTE
ncbi:MotE family protein [Fredinandcohnia humi]